MSKILQKLSDNDIIKALENHGSPLYIFDEEGFISNFHKLYNAFRDTYANYKPAYSYKTNYTPYICKLVKKMKGFAEVVSDMELTLAKKIGYNNSQIIYNGPCKGPLLEPFLLDGGVSNIDNLDEVEQILKIANQHKNNIIRTALRLNFDVDADYISRFGLEIGPSLDNAFKLLKSVPNIKLCGLHCHISRARGLEAWNKRINTLLHVADIYFDSPPEFIDVGSGMFAEMDESLASQFQMHIPSYEEYAKIVGGAMFKHYKSFKTKPILISEPGTTVIARYISIITIINNLKVIREKAFATVDASYYNIGEICHWKKLPYRIIKMHKGTIVPSYSNLNIMGYTCLEQDCIYDSFPETLENNDILIFGNVGGYSIVSKPPFIRPNCKMLVLNKDMKFKEIMRDETFEDVFNTFIF